MAEILSHPGVSLVVGIVGAAILVLVARRFDPRRELLIYGVGLGITALAYLVFGLLLGAPRDHLARELVGTVLWGAAAVVGTRGRPALLALGWTAHAAWDLFFHYAHGPAFAPSWYAIFCVGFDLPVGGYIAGRVPALRSGAGAALAVLALAALPLQAQRREPIRYTVRISNPASHYLDVEATYPGADGESHIEIEHGAESRRRLRIGTYFEDG